jgi:CHAT domain-containing protein
MIWKAKQPNKICSIGFWLIRIFVMVRRRRGLFITTFLMLFLSKVFCQCPGSYFFKRKIISIYNSPTTENERQLKELLQLKQQMKECHLEKDSSYMLLLQKLGGVCFKQSDYSAAISFTKESIEIATEGERNDSVSTLALVHNYYNLFHYYGASGNPKEKYSVIDSCIAYALKGSSGFNFAIAALTDKTNYLYNKGEYSSCSRDSRLGEDIIRRYYHEKDSINYILFFVTKQANALYFSNNIYAAEKLLENKVRQFKQGRYSKYLGSFYNLLGMINIEKKDYTKALSYFGRGFKADFSIQFKKGCAHNLASVATLYAKNFSKYDTGLDYCAAALKYTDDAADSLFILKQTGNIYVLKGMHDKAQHFFQLAYNTIRPGMNETLLLQNAFQFPGFDVLQNLTDLTTDKGDAYLQQYYYTKSPIFLKKALSVYKKADLFLAKIKTEQQLPLGSSLVWRNTTRNLYEHAIEACYANNNIEDAFYFFEKSRAILLNDQVNERRWTADEDIAKQANLKKTIVELERNLSTVPASSPEYSAIQKKLYSSSQELNILTRNIKNKSPGFYKNYLDTAFITVGQVRREILNNSKTLVEIFSGQDAVYVLTITPNSQSFRRIDKHLYDSLINSYNLFIANRELLNKSFPDFVKASSQLYGLLFQTLPAYGSIIISPDGVNFPFEALITNNSTQHPDYFLNHFATSYTYSVRYLTNQFAAKASAGESLLGIAPVEYKRYGNLSTLTGSDRSLENINKYFSGTTNFVSEKATRSNFLNNFPRFAIIQLYTHAADTSLNNDPVIYFSDSALYLSDLITAVRPVTQLVILSACETAKGKLYQGEGIFSFNRGFAALGIPAAISNLWSVENESTYLITELFYKYLSQGLATDVALQKAKIEFMNSSSTKEKTLPFFWAGSILTGKVDTLKNNPNFPWIKFSVAAILVLAIIYLTGKRIRLYLRVRKTCNNFF